ncbi:unnamed protein product, partial [Prorocentrum cordatum]
RSKRDAFSAPCTTYEGSQEDMKRLQELTCGVAGGFGRAMFIKECRSQATLQKKYRMEEELGRGATAIVYRAVTERTGQDVAVKVINKEHVANAQMLTNEIAIHKATDHPNVLRLLETFEDDCRLYLVSELCEGGDLWKFLAAYSDEFSSGLPEEDALVVFQQVVNVVVYLHSRGIVHRDLKPGNFLIPSASSGLDGFKRDGRAMIVKLTDFGVSAYGGAENCSGKHKLTRRVGTEGFMAPEILKCQPYNEKADVFSMGCILHMLLTGHPPKQKEDGTYVFSKIRLRFMSEGVRELLHLMTATRPEDRPSAREVFQMPVLQSMRTGRMATSARLDSTLLDRMYAYSSFPLLKKAAIVAMVTRTENLDDRDFSPVIQKFMSLLQHEATGIVVDDVYDALCTELLGNMRDMVRDTLRRQAASGAGMAGPSCRAAPLSRRRRARTKEARAGAQLAADGGCCPLTARFCSELRADVKDLLEKIDVSGSGCISYSEWLAATIDPAWYTDGERIRSAFRLFDTDGDGLLNAEDLKRIIPDVFEKLAAEEVLEESQLSAKQKSWISPEHWQLLLQTDTPSKFRLKRIAKGLEDPLVGTASSLDVPDSLPPPSF